MINKSNSYDVRAYCRNCHTYTTVLIPKGVLVRDVVKRVVCENCGCKGWLKE